MLRYHLIYIVLLSLHLDVLSASTNESPITGYFDIDPYMKIVSASEVSELNLDISEKHYANAHRLSAQSRDTEVYQKLGSYPLCILSNDIDNGVFLKITSPKNPVYTKIVNGVKQLSMYNESTGDKIALILVVTPAGWTNNTHSFGYSSPAGTASKGVAFVIGAPYSNGMEVPINLCDIDDSTLPKSQRLKNLALDTYGIINHYGLNPVLRHADVLIDSQSNGSVKVMRGCVGDKEPSDDESFVDLSITVDIYVNTRDLSASTAGAYRLQFATNWADSNDITLNNTARTSNN